MMGGVRDQIAFCSQMTCTKRASDFHYFGIGFCQDFVLILVADELRALP